jgi:hypothetical protein
LAKRKRKLNKDPIYRPSKYAKKISTSSDNANLLLGQDLTENGVKEEEQHAKDDLAANTGASMAKPQSQVVEGPELAITDMSPGESTDKIPPVEEVQIRPASPISTVSPSTTESTIPDMILEAVQVIHRLSKYRTDVPRAIHVRILQAIQNAHSGQVTAPIDTRWSDGSTWVQILDMGSSAGIRTTVLNMVEYIGAWEWFDEQCKHAEVTVYTKKGKLVERRGAASYVLDMVQCQQPDITAPGKWISGVGPVTVKEIGDEANFEGKRKELRKRITNQLYRGEKLSKLVKVVRLGILLNPKIW